MNTKQNTGESEDSELAIDKKSVADEWFENLDKDAPESEPDEHMKRYYLLKENKLQIC